MTTSALRSDPLDDKTVVVCHHPGAGDSTETIHIAEAAVTAHLKHGDVVGACASGCDQTGCDDGDLCTSDRCVEGNCENIPVGCDDADSCTLDSCQPTIGCTYAPADGAPCEDGNACTTEAVCTDGRCVGSTIPGCCHDDVDCGDGDPCTVDRCDSNTCSNEPMDCSVADRCQVGFCNPASGSCETAPMACDDSNPCNVDACDPVQGCMTTPALEGTSCSDGNGCTFDDVCHEGVCRGELPGETCNGTDDDCDGQVDDGDTDGDGESNCADGCPDDPMKTSPGLCGCGVSDTDSDADGDADCRDACASDPLKQQPGLCGCGKPDTSDTPIDVEVTLSPYPQATSYTVYAESASGQRVQASSASTLIHLSLTMDLWRYLCEAKDASNSVIAHYEMANLTACADYSLTGSPAWIAGAHSCIDNRTGHMVCFTERPVIWCDSIVMPQVGYFQVSGTSEGSAHVEVLVDGKVRASATAQGAPAYTAAWRAANGMLYPWVAHSMTAIAQTPWELPSFPSTPCPFELP